MINLRESHLILIILLSMMISYYFYTYFFDYTINCKVNYYKYENYHDSKINDSQNAKNQEIELPGISINKVEQNNDNLPLQSSSLFGEREDNTYINKLFIIN